MANQMLACIALAVGTTVIINSGKARYAWVTLVPLVFITIIEMTAGYQNIRDNYWPLVASPSTMVRGYIYTAITGLLMAGLAIVLVGSARKWLEVRNARLEVSRLEAS